MPGRCGKRDPDRPAAAPGCPYPRCLRPYCTVAVARTDDVTADCGLYVDAGAGHGAFFIYKWPLPERARRHAGSQLRFASAATYSCYLDAVKRGRPILLGSILLFTRVVVPNSLIITYCTL